MGLALDVPKFRDEAFDIDGVPVVMSRMDLRALGAVRIELMGGAFIARPAGCSLQRPA